jgi:hypothetical protein
MVAFISAGYFAGRHSELGTNRYCEMFHLPTGCEDLSTKPPLTPPMTSKRRARSTRALGRGPPCFIVS